MSRKIFQNILLAICVTAALSAGTVSARQLRSGAKGVTTCGGSCGINKPCAKGCLCIFPMESGSPFCSSHPIPGASLAK